jgi:2,4-dienoyl-CoA reductase-like NADH-dependent reductase (Old Yellow Enzyme family)/thioredoxin reductase
MLKYSKLFSPLQIGDLTFRNRIFSSPTGYMDFFRDGTTPTEDMIAYYTRKAEGGAATVCIGECHINPAVSRAGELGVDITDDTTMRFVAKIADRVRRLGAVASMEIQHGGLAADARLGPSEVYVAGDPTIACHAMTEGQIYETIELFANAAARAQYYGFGMVTVHGGHGWLLQQFFSPATNKRTDEWGGSPENRARLSVAVCDAIHERCGRGFPVEMRISVTEFEDGYDVPEGVEYAKRLDGHADIIHCSAGIHGNTKRGNSLRWAPSMYEPDGPFVTYAAEVKKHVKKSLVSTVGGHTDPRLMEQILESGAADIISVARALNCDPDLPNKARAGRDDEIRKCIRCYACSDALFPTFRILCALDPESGRETEFTDSPAPPEKQRVLVAGGGIGGMEAAVVCAKRGHSVVLCEKGPRLGGALLCEEAVPFKNRLMEYIELQRRAIESLGVEVRLNTEVTPSFIEAEAPDVVIASLGAAHAAPGIEGVKGTNVLSVEEAFSNPDRVGEQVVIIGAGPSGAELAVYLNMRGKKPELVEMRHEMPGPGVQSIVTRIELEDRGVIIHYDTRAEKITDDGVWCASPEGALFLPADTVVTATGVRPRIEETLALSAVSPAFHIVGDCANYAGGLGVKNATETAHTVAAMIGKRRV